MKLAGQFDYSTWMDLQAVELGTIFGALSYQWKLILYKLHLDFHWGHVYQRVHDMHLILSSGNNLEFFRYKYKYLLSPEIKLHHDNSSLNEWNVDRFWIQNWKNQLKLWVLRSIPHKLWAITSDLHWKNKKSKSNPCGKKVLENAFFRFRLHWLGPKFCSTFWVFKVIHYPWPFCEVVTPY